MGKVNSILLVLVITTTAVLAQTAELHQYKAPFDLESGNLINGADQRTVIFEEIIKVADASWLRLKFDDIVLGKAPLRAEPTQLRLTSLLDGAVQTMNSEHLSQWRNTTAYFNGDAVLLEIIADSGAKASRVAMSEVWMGPFLTEEERTRSICGPTDDRLPSSDQRAAKMSPIGCSVWLIDDANHTFLTAGHCINGEQQIIEFNVPMANSDGSANHPPPEDQYVVDNASIQAGGANDWAYFGTFRNPVTGLTPYQMQGVNYVLANPPASPTGVTIRITGYGTTDLPIPNEWNAIQKTHTGPHSSTNATSLFYQTDTTGGNSGSAVEWEEMGVAIGIHTNAGCSAGGGSNRGTNITDPAIQTALGNPQGVCIPTLVEFSYPEGLPQYLMPDGDTIRVTLTDGSGGVPQAGSGMLHYDIGAGTVSIPMVQLSPNIYDATFPALDCSTPVHYWFSAMSTSGLSATSPNGPFMAVVAEEETELWSDNFETDTGWTVTNDVGLTDGAWERGTPLGGGLRGDPTADADGSGQCYLTDNAAGNSDVDGGHTWLTSPLLDGTSSNAYIVYWLWYSNTLSAFDDTMLVELSDNNGATWVELETVGAEGAVGGWLERAFKISDFVTNTNQIRIRFDALDIGDGSIIEAGVDGVRVIEYNCETALLPCPLDLSGDRNITADDLGLAYETFTEPEGDVDGDGYTTVLDMLLILDNLGETCPE